MMKTVILCVTRSAAVVARFALEGSTYLLNPCAGLEETLRGWAEEGVVEWWGRRDDIPRVMAESYVVCLPSKYGEGVPKVLVLPH
jgi:hypothetical protein